MTWIIESLEIAHQEFGIRNPSSAGSNLQAATAGGPVEIAAMSTIGGDDEAVSRSGREAQPLRQADHYLALRFRDEEAFADAHVRDDGREDNRHGWVNRRADAGRERIHGPNVDVGSAVHRHG